MYYIGFMLIQTWKQLLIHATIVLNGALMQAFICRMENACTDFEYYIFDVQCSNLIPSARSSRCLPIVHSLPSYPTKTKKW